jgi:hypothetical protein
LAGQTVDQLEIEQTVKKYFLIGSVGGSLSTELHLYEELTFSSYRCVRNKKN